MNPTRNMAAYRTLLAQVAKYAEFTAPVAGISVLIQASKQPPVIPFLPLLMKDLAFIHEGNETFVDGMLK